MRSSDFQNVTVRTTFSTSPICTGKSGILSVPSTTRRVATGPASIRHFTVFGITLPVPLPLYPLSCQSTPSILS